MSTDTKPRKPKTRHHPRVCLDEPVSALDIAERLGVTASTVSHWIARPIGFPKPKIVLRPDNVKGGIKIWDWAEVNAWFQENRR